MTSSLRARQMKVEAVEARSELILRSLDALHRKVLALQAVTVALADRCDLSDGDVASLAAELCATYPPELAPCVREEIARLLQP